MRLRPAICALLAVAPLAACGTGPSEEDSARVVDRFQAAVAGSDGVGACEQLTDHLRATLEEDEGEPCAEAVLGQGLRGGGRATRSRVYVTSALVTVDGGGDAFLDETGEGWRISAAGCVREPGTVDYRCRLED